MYYHSIALEISYENAQAGDNKGCQPFCLATHNRNGGRRKGEW